MENLIVLQTFFESFGNKIFQFKMRDVMINAREFLLAKNINASEGDILFTLASYIRSLQEPKSISDTRVHLKIYLKALGSRIKSINTNQIIQWAISHLKSKNVWTVEFEEWFHTDIYKYIAEECQAVSGQDQWAERRKDSTSEDEILEKSEISMEIHELDDKIHGHHESSFIMLNDEEEYNYDIIYEENMQFIISMVDRHFIQRDTQNQVLNQLQTQI